MESAKRGEVERGSPTTNRDTRNPVGPRSRALNYKFVTDKYARRWSNPGQNQLRICHGASQLEHGRFRGVTCVPWRRDEETSGTASTRNRRRQHRLRGAPGLFLDGTKFTHGDGPRVLRAEGETCANRWSRGCNSEKIQMLRNEHI